MTETHPHNYSRIDLVTGTCSDIAVRLAILLNLVVVCMYRRMYESTDKRFTIPTLGRDKYFI